MKITLLLCCMSFIVFFANAQSSFYKYVNEPNISGSTFFTCLATNSGYVFAGSANNLIFDSHLFFTRMTTTGTVQQMRTFTAGGFNNFSCAIQTTDGNFAYYGTQISNVNFVGSLVLLKLDIVGNYQITKTYSDPNYSFAARKMFQDAQGNFYMVANASNNITFENSMCLIVTDPSGNITSQKFFNPGIDFSAMDIIAAPGNGVLLTGYAQGASIETIVLIKLNSALNIDWSKWFSDPSVKYFHYDISAKSSGNYILCGRYDDGVNPYSTLIIEIDTSGNQVWAKKYPSTNNTPNHAYSVVLTSAGAAIVGGGIDTSPGMGPILAMSVDASNGNLNWSKQVNTGASRELIYEMKPTPTGGIIACGARGGNGAMLKVDTSFDNCADQPYSVSESSVTLTVSSINPVASTSSLVAGSWTATPVTFANASDACLGLGLNEVPAGVSVSLFPNPVNDQLNIQSDLTVNEINVFDALGKLVLNLNSFPEGKIQINTSGFQNGIYSLQLISNQKTITSKFAKAD